MKRYGKMVVTVSIFKTNATWNRVLIFCANFCWPCLWPAEIWRNLSTNKLRNETLKSMIYTRNFRLWRKVRDSLKKVTPVVMVPAMPHRKINQDQNSVILNVVILIKCETYQVLINMSQSLIIILTKFDNHVRNVD